MESTPGQTQQQTQSQAEPGAVAADPGQQQQQVAAEAAAAAPSANAPVTTAQVVATAAANGDASTLNALQAPSSSSTTQDQIYYDSEGSPYTMGADGQPIPTVVVTPKSSLDSYLSWDSGEQLHPFFPTLDPKGMGNSVRDVLELSAFSGGAGFFGLGSGLSALGRGALQVGRNYLTMSPAAATIASAPEINAAANVAADVLAPGAGLGAAGALATNSATAGAPAAGGGMGDIAFGLTRNQETGAPDLLSNFANNVGAKTYSDFYDRRIFPTEGMLEKLMYGGDQLHVNLDGLLESPSQLPNVVQMGSRGLDFVPSEGGGNITNWEVWRIHQDPLLLNKTTFYFNGAPISK